MAVIPFVSEKMSNVEGPLFVVVIVYFLSGSTELCT